MSDLAQYRFDDLYEISSGISTTKEQAGHGSPFVSFSTIYNNYYLPDELPDLMETSEAEQIKYSVQEADVFVTRTSETLDELAMSCVSLNDYPEATFSGFAKRLRPKYPSFPDPTYIAFYLRGPHFRKMIDNMAIMTTRASFNETLFSFLKLSLPNKETQQRVGALLLAIQEKMGINNQVNDNLVDSLAIVA